MKKIVGIFLLIVLLVVSTVIIIDSPEATTAQQSEDVTVTINSVDDNNFPELNIRLTVLDNQSQPVDNLTAEDFSILLNADEQNITSVEQIINDDLSVSVVLVLDTSESMLGTPLDNTKIAANLFLDNLGEGDEVAIVDFDSTADVALEFTTDLDAARETIAGLEAGGRTALYDASAVGADVALNANSSRRFVVLLTDGNEFGGLSAAGPEQGASVGAENDIPFFTIGLGFSINEIFLDTLANRTSGSSFITPSADELPTIFDDIANFLRNQYIVTVNADIEPDGSTYNLTADTQGVSDSFDYTAIDLYPQISISGLPEDEITEPVTVTIDVDAPRSVATVDVTSSSPTIPGLAADGGDESFSTEFEIDPFAFPAGENRITVTASDTEGGIREAEFTFDVVAIDSVFTVDGIPDDGLVDTPSLDISVDVEQAQGTEPSVEILVDGEVVDSGTGDSVDATLDILEIGEGSHTVDVSIIAGEDNVTTESFDIVVDDQLFVTPTATPTATPTNTPTATPTATDTPLPTSTPLEIDFEVSGIESNEVIIEPSRLITVTTDNPQIDSVVFVLDSANPATVNQEPWEYTLNALSAGSGGHTLEIRVINEFGEQVQRNIIFRIDPGLFVTPSRTPVMSRTPTTAPTDEPTEVAQATDTLAPTDTVAPTDTIEPTDTAEPTDTPEPTDEPEPTAIPFEITIEGLEDGEVISDTERDIVITGTDGAEIGGVVVTVDGQEVVNESELPIETTLDILGLGAGDHDVSISVTDADGEVTQESVTFTADDALFVTPTATPAPADDGDSSDDEDDSNALTDNLPIIAGILIVLIGLFLVWRNNQNND